MNAGGTSLWVEAAVAALLVSSGVFVVISAIGFSRFQDFFLRMHPPALAYTLGGWCVAGAATLHFTARGEGLALHPLIITILLCVTVPVTTVLLSRVALFRRRRAGTPDTPPPLSAPKDRVPHR